MFEGRHWLDHQNWFKIEERKRHDGFRQQALHARVVTDKLPAAAEALK